MRGLGPAKPILGQVAHTYNATITYGELASAVQKTTGIIRKQLIHYWVGEIAFQRQRPGEPML